MELTPIILKNIYATESIRVDFEYVIPSHILRHKKSV